MSRQAVRVTKETTIGAFPGSPGVGTQAYIRLIGDDAFPGRVMPNVFFVRDAAGNNRNVNAGKSTWKCEGSINTLLYYEQAKVLLPWAGNLIADGGGFKPPYTLAMDHRQQMEDATPTTIFCRYLGCYCDSMTIKGSNSGDGVKISINAAFKYLGVDRTITVSDFADPALSAYPAGSPAVFQHVAGGFTLGSSRTSFRSFEITIKNILDQIYDESAYPQAIKWCGRDVSLKVEVRHKATTDRTAFEAVTSQTAAIVLTDGTTTITFDFKANAITAGVTDSNPLDKAHYQSLDSTVMVDPSAGTDLAITVSP